MIEVSQCKCEVNADTGERVTLLEGNSQALCRLSHRLDVAEDEGHALAGEVAQLVVAPDDKGGIASVVLAKRPHKLRSSVVQPVKERRREIPDVEAGGALHLDVVQSPADDLAVVLQEELAGLCGSSEAKQQPHGPPGRPGASPQGPAGRGLQLLHQHLAEQVGAMVEARPHVSEGMRVGEILQVGLCFFDERHRLTELSLGDVDV